jgi:DNA invertase Pin-like site-specific DNA recombinase
VESPDEHSELTPEISEILIEIRDLKASLVKSADRLGRLEKKLRTKLKEG